MPAWRARAHHLTRSRAFLGKAVAVILTTSALIAALVHFLRPETSPHWKSLPITEQQESFKALVHEEGKQLQSMDDADPATLVAWLRKTADRRPDKAEGSGDFDAAALRLAGVELAPLIAKHTTTTAQKEAAAAYVRFRLLQDGESRRSALHALGQIAEVPTPPPHANEMLGDALLICGQTEAALQAYLKDAATPEATHARKRAVTLAINGHDRDALEKLSADERVIREIRPGALFEAASQTGNRRLLLLSLWRLQWESWMQRAAVPLAMLAGAIWYIILIHTASREPWRWWRHLSAVFAGVASIWLLRWWQGTLNYRSDPEGAPSMTHEIIEWIMTVGLPEEAAKLVLFAFFLPVLLHHRSGVKAALTAGCVGLGFAIDENLQYFANHGPQVAIGRLLTANFMHVSLTGILGWHLYELFRSRFHHATEFLTAFCAVTVAHGLYDFSAGPAASEWGFNIGGMIILALCARTYLPLLHDDPRSPSGGYTITRTAVFGLGMALLGGMLMIVLVWDLQSLEGITIVLEEMVALALVALIYIREWREV